MMMKKFCGAHVFIPFNKAVCCFVSLLFASLVVSCATSPVSDAPELGGAGYAIAEGDQLVVNIYDEPTLSGVYRVNSVGNIDLPLIGPIRSAGLSLLELQAAITQGYAGRYLSDPVVRVDLESARPVYILGEVNRPGEYEYTSAQTMLQSIAKAGGFTYRANRSVIYVLHHQGAEEKKYKLTPTTVVYPGDTIRVVQRFF